MLLNAVCINIVHFVPFSCTVSAYAELTHATAFLDHLHLSPSFTHTYAYQLRFGYITFLSFFCTGYEFPII